MLSHVSLIRHVPPSPCPLHRRPVSGLVASGSILQLTLIRSKWLILSLNSPKSLLLFVGDAFWLTRPWDRLQLCPKAAPAAESATFGLCLRVVVKLTITLLLLVDDLRTPLNTPPLPGLCQKSAPTSLLSSAQDNQHPSVCVNRATSQLKSQETRWIFRRMRNLQPMGSWAQWQQIMWGMDYLR